jgi:hypothetical protein
MTEQKQSWRFRLADWLESKATGINTQKEVMKAGRTNIISFKKKMKEVQDVDVDEVTDEAMITEQKKE